MKLTKYIHFALIALLAVPACKKNNVPVPKPDVDVYVAGQISKITPGIHTLVAAYWKNGVSTTLSDNYWGNANAITVVGTDIYVAGYIIVNDSLNNSITIGTYWKNGVATSLGPNTVCTSIVVKGTDVYVAGYSTPPPTNNNTGFDILTTNNRVGTYWKNGIATTLGSNTSCTSITVIGSDVYITGSINNSAAFWKNGIITKLAGGHPDSWANAIAVNGSDTYIIGTTGLNNGLPIAAYWRNGVITELTSVSPSIAQSVTVNGGDIYIAGSFNYRAAYWKNGVLNELPQDWTNLNSSIANAIAVNYNDVYLVGNLGLDAAYWKNWATPQLDQKYDAGINAITIVPH